MRRRWGFPAACGEDHAETDFPLQSMEVHWEAGIYPAACPDARARWMYPEVGCSIYRVYATAAVRSCDLWGKHTEAVPEGLYTAERIHAAAILEELHLWEGSYTGTGEEDVEEEVAEEKCYQVTTSPLPFSPALLVGRR